MRLTAHTSSPVFPDLPSRRRRAVDPPTKIESCNRGDCGVEVFGLVTFRMRVRECDLGVVSVVLPVGPPARLETSFHVLMLDDQLPSANAGPTIPMTNTFSNCGNRHAI